jgi:hypothetical protein
MHSGPVWSAALIPQGGGAYFFLQRYSLTAIQLRIRDIMPAPMD